MSFSAVLTCDAKRACRLRANYHDRAKHAKHRFTCKPNFFTRLTSSALESCISLLLHCTIAPASPRWVENARRPAPAAWRIPTQARSRYRHAIENTSPRTLAKVKIRFDPSKFALQKSITSQILRGLSSINRRACSGCFSRPQRWRLPQYQRRCVCVFFRMIIVLSGGVREAGLLHPHKLFAR